MRHRITIKMTKAGEEFVDMKLAIMVGVIKKQEIPKLAACPLRTSQFQAILKFGLL